MNTQTFNPTTTKVQFLKEWTPEQFKAMDKAIVKHFRNKFIRTLHETFMPYSYIYRQLDHIFGLAYTSTGIWACYGVCNTEVYFDEDNIYQYSYFTMGNNGIPYAVLQDCEENELTIAL